MDPKNYTGGYGSAKDKMLSYLKNLEHFGAKIGVLFFSNAPGAIIPPKTYVKYNEGKEILYEFHQNISHSKEKLDNHFDMIFEEIKNEL